MDNRQRAHNAGIALATYADYKGEELDGDCTIVDLISDLLHCAKFDGYEPEKILSMARGHFEAELS